MDLKLNENGSKNGPKMDPKWTQNRPKMDPNKPKMNTKLIKIDKSTKNL